MNHHLGQRALHRVFAIGFALIMALALTASMTAGQADAKKKRPTKVNVKINTKNQKQLLKQNKLKVRIRANGKTKLKVLAKSGGKGNLFKKKNVRFKKRGKKVVSLKLTKRGRKTLSKCGAKRVIAIVKGKRIKGKKKHNKKLNRWNKKCKPKVKPISVPLGDNPQFCDFLDSSICLQPFPNDYYTKDAATPTGKQLNLNPESTPINTGNNDPVNFDVTDMNRADGFSPGNMVTLKVPGLDTPAAFDNTGFVSLEDLSEYTSPDQAVLVIDAETGERHPIWAEIDSNPTAVDPKPGNPGGIGLNPGNTDPVNLLVRPAESYENGKRYIVAFRNLKNEADETIEAPLGFQAYRDQRPTKPKQNIVENRRSHMNSIINTLTNKAGVDRSSLYMAWDFTVASEESLTGRATTIRDDAYARLGDTNLADSKIQGASPDVDVLAWCDKSDMSASSDCGNNYPGIGSYKTNLPTTSPTPGGGQQRTVVGFIRDVPCYLDQNGCSTGAEFMFDAQDKLTWNPAFTQDVPFRCMVPSSVVDGGSVTPGGTGTYGHGLLGTLNQINATTEVGNENNSTWCAANWDGFSDLDLATIGASLADMSNFNKAADRMQQGFVNFMMLGRAMMHPDGFATEPAFQMDHNGSTPITSGSAIDTSKGADTRHYYFGISQGGIMGGALTALSPDVDHGVLGVPGINYSSLLRRSVDSDEYFKAPGFGLYANYPKEDERPLLLALIQLLWDRGEGNGYANNLGDNPALPNTNQSQVLLRVALGDHQVTNYAADVQARTYGALRYEPTLLAERHNWDVTYEALPPVSTFPTTGDKSYTVYYDGGPVGYQGNSKKGTDVPPIGNVPPRPEWGFGDDPHSLPRKSPDGINQAASFLKDGTIDACVGTGGLCFSNGWDGVQGLP